MTITSDLVKRTLSDNVDGFKFENFSQTFFSAIEGQEYKPVGGIHDGGADGIFENDGMFEVEKKNTHFIQISIDKTPKTKIRNTIHRLRSYGRTVKQLTYITSIIVPDIDKLEDSIFDDFDLRLKIRDANYIASNIQYSQQTEAAFRTNLLETYGFLQQFGHSSIQFQNDKEDAPFLYVFLQQELHNKTDRSSLLNSLTDSLILWALEETDPDKKIFMTVENIRDKIITAMPTSKTFINSTIKHRLESLCKKQSGNNQRSVQHWSSKKNYCLPFKTRKKIIEQNIKDEELYVSVESALSNQLSEFVGEKFDAKDIKIFVKITLRTLHITFEKEGLEFISFIQNPENFTPKPPVINNIDRAFDELFFKGNHSDAKEVIRKLLAHIFYQKCDENISIYLQKLSETYALLLSLKADTRVVDYFQNMSSKFFLFVGSDILVRCLSERFLDEEKKATVNMLKILDGSGSNFFLTELVLDEVWNNLKTSDWEYKNHFASIDQYMKPELAKESSKILIRAYYYSKFSNKKSKSNSWISFVEQFCTYSNLHESLGREQLKNYLIRQFNFDFFSMNNISNIIDNELVQDLSKKLENKKKKELAVNAATMVDLIYKQRKINKESSTTNGFGFSTWWLTGEKSTLQYTGFLVKENFGFYIIRPEFLLHYISLMPSNRDIKETYKNIFPSVMGIKMSGRIPQDEYHKLLKKIEQAKEYEPGRLEVLIDETINNLKGDFIREYDDYNEME